MASTKERIAEKLRANKAKQQQANLDGKRAAEFQKKKEC